MKFTPHSPEKKTIAQHFFEARNRGVMLVISSSSGKKGMLTEVPESCGKYRLMFKNGTFTVPVSGADPFITWKLIGEIDLSPELD